MPRPVVVNHFVRFAVKDPKWHILNALGVEPGVEVSGRGDGGGEAVGVLVDGGEGPQAAHGVAEHHPGAHLPARRFQPIVLDAEGPIFILEENT